MLCFRVCGRDYLQDIEGHIAAKVETFKVQQLAMYTELVERNPPAQFFDSTMDDVAEMAERTLEASFQETLTRLKMDQQLFFKFIADKSKAESHAHINLVLHLQAQEARGNQFAVNRMDKYCLMLNSEPGKPASDAFLRKASRIHAAKLNREVLTNDIYNIVWLDWTKLGRLKQTDVNEYCEYVKTLIANNAPRSCCFMMAPLLVSDSVTGGLRGECRPGILFAFAHCPMSDGASARNKSNWPGESRTAL
jgi:hypothetical protein